MSGTEDHIKVGKSRCRKGYRLHGKVPGDSLKKPGAIIVNRSWPGIHLSPYFLKSLFDVECFPKPPWYKWLGFQFDQLPLKTVQPMHNGCWRNASLLLSSS
jgi:hypothetical protein